MAGGEQHKLIGVGDESHALEGDEAAAERSGPVVAVLGGLHVNGVARLLMETATPDADGRPNDGVWWAAPADLATDEWV